MGDLIGNAVAGTLYYIAPGEFERAKKLDLPREKHVALFADMCRLNTLYMIANAGSGHIGSSFSSMDIMSWVMNEELRQGSEDAFFSSKGHDAPGYYSVMMATGRMPFDKIHTLRKLGGLPGHPDVKTPGIVTNTGSLGMGISKAKGMVTANRLQKKDGRIFVMTGDGELQEGQIWESLSGAVNGKFEEITVIVDHNKLQSDTFVRDTSDLGSLDAKFVSFGWHVERIDGHDIQALCDAIEHCKAVKGRPQVIIADTIKGRGVSFMEHTGYHPHETEYYQFHSGAPSEDHYISGTQELINRINRRLSEAKATELELETVERARPPAAAENAPAPQKIIGAYSQALRDLARRRQDVVALDADLCLDLGLIPFRKEFPSRYFECGIAEMDMVSQAGGLALKGMLPVVNSFACFLSTRPNEQIYNNATEHTKVIYVGALAGFVPAAPGHSHQSVRDISAIGGMPGMVVLDPSCEAEVPLLLDWAADENDGSAYFRLASMPQVLEYELPAGYRIEKGKGCVLKDGTDVVLIAYGPVMLTQAMKAAEAAAADGVSVKVVNLPFLNVVDAGWLAGIVKGAKAVVTLDNHYVQGGQGQMLAATLAQSGIHLPVKLLGLTEMPACGTPDQVLAHHKLDAASIANEIRSAIS